MVADRDLTPTARTARVRELLISLCPTPAPPTDAQVDAYLAAHPDSPPGERLRLRQLILPDSSTAQLARDRLRNGESFAALSRELSRAPNAASGGLIGWVERGQLPPEFEAVVFGLAPGAEVTVEASPETVDQRVLADLRAGGMTRISLGMQSAVPHVLAVLDRVHEPGRPARCARWARAAGFEHVSLDLIYGTPGESDADWRYSLAEALAAGPDHISAYALIVEEGTALAARVRRGEVGIPDDDVMADRYLAADDLLSVHGMSWYEISNWAAGDGARCRHNLLYWTGGDWWGVGPGAHSHVGGTRWWNVKHPAAYATRIGSGRSPAQAREILTERERHLERVLLLTRLAEGCPVAELGPAGRAAAASAVAGGLAQPAAHADGRVVLTPKGRLLADAVVGDLTG